MNRNVSLIPTELVEHVWPEVAPIMARAVPSSGGRYTINDIYAECLSGAQHLWVAFDERKNIIGCLTTRVVVYPQKRMLAGQFCAGVQMNQWQTEMLATLDSWAKDNDCAGLEMTGRFGWTRVLNKYGWRHQYNVYEKDI